MNLALTSSLSKSVETRIPAAAAVLFGACFIAAASQIRIPLPFTPVPITGQTFAVTSLAFLLGGRRAPAAVALYLAAGFAGLPVFAGGRSGFVLGPTFGYLIGMLASSFLVGSLSDRGFTRSWGRAFAGAIAGSTSVHFFGLLGLSFFVPHETLLTVGFLPFLPGDVIKTSLAVSMARAAHQAFGDRR